MIDTEIYKVLPNGQTLVRTYSTEDKMIERDGVLYGEAIDDATFGYEYTETGIPIEGEDATEDATEADYLRALERLGVAND